MKRSGHNVVFALAFGAAEVLALLFAPPVSAVQQATCDEAAVISHHGDAMINEEALQQHIDELSKQMYEIRHTRGPHVDRTLTLRRHLSHMREAMQVLHDRMYLMGCRVDKQDVSLEVRVEAMEKQLKFMNQMLEQVIEHLSESGAEPALQNQ